MSAIILRPTEQTQTDVAQTDTSQTFTLMELIRLFGTKSSFTVTVRHPLNRSREFTFEADLTDYTPSC